MATSRLAAVLLVALLSACSASSRPAPKPPAPPDKPPATAPEPEARFALPPAAEAAPDEAPQADAAAPRMRVHLIDVGQGAATLIEFSCAAILIDTGGESNASFDSNARLASYLEAFFDGRPDLKNTIALLLITHPHIDHARGAKSVWAKYKIENVVTDGLTTGSGGPQQKALISSARAASSGLAAVKASSIAAGGLTNGTIDPVSCDDGDPDIRVLWGAVARSNVRWSQKAFDNANNHSVVVKVSLGQGSLVVTGDLEEEGIKELLKRHDGSGALDADVYEVGHHGSANATTSELLDAISPKLALLGVGSTERKEMWTAWAYGHPRADVAELLAGSLTGKPRPEIEVSLGIGAKQFVKRKITAPIFATAWDGHVILTMFADGSIGVQSSHGTPPP